MVEYARRARPESRPEPGFQLTPTSGLALGLTVSSAIWIALLEAVHLVGWL